MYALFDFIIMNFFFNIFSTHYSRFSSQKYSNDLYNKVPYDGF